MLCTHCGTQLPEGTVVCPYCRSQQRINSPAGYNGYGMTAKSPPRVDNIFSSLTYNRRTGNIAEFVLWCGVCLCVILSLLSVILVDGDYGYTSGFRLFYIFLMIEALGAGVLFAFRLKAIMLLYMNTFFMVIMFITWYLTSMAPFIDVTGLEVPGGCIAVFIINLLVGIGVVTCCSIQFFSRINLYIVNIILSCVFCVLLLLMLILGFVLPSSEWEWEIGSYYVKSMYWLGGITYLLLCIIPSIYLILARTGVIDAKRMKIYEPRGSSRAFAPGLQGVAGAYAGRVIYLQGRELSIGSQQGGVSVFLSDPYVSHRHCQVRFNPGTNFYEVMDISTNGVFLNGTTRLPAGNYVTCPRGSIICIGGMNQQFKLL